MEHKTAVARLSLDNRRTTTRRERISKPKTAAFLGEALLRPQRRHFFHRVRLRVSYLLCSTVRRRAIKLRIAQRTNFGQVQSFNFHFRRDTVANEHSNYFEEDVERDKHEDEASNSADDFSYKLVPAAAVKQTSHSALNTVPATT